MKNENLEDRFINDLNSNIGIVHRVCKVYGRDPREKQDLFQEIVYQLWKSYPTFTGSSKFSTWMYKVAMNTAIGAIRKSSRALPNRSLSGQLPEIPDLTDPSDPEEKMQRLYAAINELSPIEKAIILLYLDEHSYEQIAAFTGLTKTHISVRLVRIKKRLEQKLKY